jgi:hypothetical protein
MVGVIGNIRVFHMCDDVLSATTASLLGYDGVLVLRVIRAEYDNDERVGMNIL